MSVFSFITVALCHLSLIKNTFSVVGYCCVNVRVRSINIKTIASVLWGPPICFHISQINHARRLFFILLQYLLFGSVHPPTQEFPPPLHCSTGQSWYEWHEWLIIHTQHENNELLWRWVAKLLEKLGANSVAWVVGCVEGYQRCHQLVLASYQLMGVEILVSQSVSLSGSLF